MLQAEGYEPCCVSAPGLFEELRELSTFELLLVGVPALDSIPATVRGGLPLTVRGGLASTVRSGSVGGVLLLATQDPDLVSHLRVLAPEAQILDRRLEHPDAMRRALRRREEALAPPEAGNAVRGAFEPFDLSERQFQVVELALRGQSSHEIGERLFISERTVRNHLHAIYQTLGVTGRRQLQGHFVHALLDATPTP